MIQFDLRSINYMHTFNATKQVIISSFDRSMLKKIITNALCEFDYVIKHGNV